MFHYTAETKKTVEETIEALTENLKTEKFGVLWHFDVQNTFQKNELDYDQAFRVLEVCNPVAAHKAITTNPFAGYFIPCKIAVYEEGGKTKIGLAKPTALMDLISDQNLKDVATDVENRLIACINESL